jgi:type II secretion system protein I
MNIIIPSPDNLLSKEAVAARESVPFRRSPFYVRSRAAFTLIEVMIAMGIFFMAIFAILSVVSGCLRNARLLQHKSVDASMLIAELSLTNQLVEGSDSGDLGKDYPGYKWERSIEEVGTNGLFHVEYMVTGPMVGAQTPPQSHMSVLMWRPASGSGLKRP